MANSAMDKWLKQAQSRKPAEEKQQEDPMDKWLKQAQSRKPVETKPVETAKKPAPVVSSVYKSATWSPTVPMAARNAAMADVNAIFAEKQKQEQQAQQERQAQQETLQKLQKERAEVELTQTRANRSGGVKDKEAQKALKAREKELEAAIQKGQEALGQQTTAERLGKAGQSIALNTAGSVPLIAETAEQALENTVAYENSELNQKIENALNDVKLAKAVHGEDSREYQMASGYLEHLRNEAIGYKKTQPGVSKDGMGYQMLAQGQQLQAQALDGLTGAKRAAAEQALSLADNAAVLSLGLINPVLPSVVMGAKVNAGKIYDLTNQGVNATTALARGTVSGAIEAATEKMGVDNLFDVVKTGGKTALVNILKQAGVEGTEEGFSYLFNWMADKAAKDPNATFSPAELLANIAGGAVSGLVFGAGGTAINRLGGGSANTMPTYSENGVIRRPIQQTGKALQAPAQNSLHLEAAEEVDINALHLQAIDLDERIGQLETTLEIAEARAMLNDAESGEQDKARVAVVQRRLQNAREEYRKVLSKLQEQRERQPSASQETANALSDIDNTMQRVENEIKRIQEEGGVNLEGASLSDESAQRNDGAGAGEQTGSVGAGAGETGQGRQQRQADAQGSAAEARNLADALQVTAQSSRSLGLVRGTDDATVRMIPREQRTAYMTEVADKVRQETGREVDFYVGELRVKSSNPRGYTVANGCIMPDGRIYVQADNDTLTAEQIAMHEAAHDMIDQNSGMMAQTIQQVQERYGNEALEAMVDDYLRNLRGLDMDANSCMEEILCDAFAGINAFEAQADVLQEDVQRSFTEYRNKGSQQEQGAVSQRGPPVQQTTEAERPRAAETATRTREANVTRDEETFETERPAETLSAAEKAKRELLDALNAGEITEEDFDAAWADIMSEPEMQDRERLSVTDQDDLAKEQVQRFQRGEITADELRGYLNGMQAGQAIKNTARDNPYEGKSLSSDSDVYEYDFLTSLPDMKVTVLPDVPAVRDANGKVDTAKVVFDGIKNARSVGTERGEKIYVENAYTGRQMRVDKQTIRHGLNGKSNRLLTNARLGSVIGEVVQNAVPVNALNDKAQGVIGTYAMAGYATDTNGRAFIAIVTVEQRNDGVSGIEVYDVAHAVSGRQKKSSQADTKSQGVYPIKAADTISIADLLEIVNTTHQSVLSESVLKHFGETRNPEGEYAGKAKFSITETTERSNNENLKQRQLETILDSNPMRDNYHTGVRAVEDIKTFEEALAEPEWDYDEFDPDYTRAMAEDALKKGKIKVYSSYPIEAGAFVTPSRMEAESYAGRNRVYEKTVALGDVAWIDPTQGQFAPAQKERYSFAGTEAATADLEKLEIAKGLEQNGVEAEQIRWETGWYRGADDLWRHEIDDSGMRLKITEDISNYNRLGELIDHPALFAAYPDMKMMDVTFHRLNEGNHGKYNRTFDSIEVNYDLKNDPEQLQEVLVHEIQHAVQAREDFASGASVPFWERQLRQGYDSRPQHVKDEEARLQQEYDKLKEDRPEFVAEMEQLETLTPTVPRGEINWDTLEKIEDDPIEWQQYDAVRNTLEERYGTADVWHFMNLQRKLEQLKTGNTRNAQELYYNTAGEIEARNAAERRALTPEERRQRRPDTGRGRAVFAEDTAAYAADEDAGAIKLETVAEEEHRKMLDGLNTKERNYLQRVERRAVNQIAKALGVPYHAKREYLMPMVQELATEYMTAGEISEGTKDAVFEKAWDEGIEVDNEFYNAYKPLKDRLRNTAVMLAEQDRADIPDWNNARKNMFGVLRIVNQGGMTVDQFYEELASDYPGMFPTDIRHPADRLQRMYEVGRDIRIANLGLEQYYGPNAERYKAFARGEFENNLGEVLAEMRNVKRSAAERAEREQIKVPETPKEIMELYKTMKTSKREYEKVNAKQLLSDTDRELLNRAMRGEVNLDNIVDDGRYNLQGVKAVYAAKQVYEQQARVIRDYNRKRKAGLRNQADEYLKNAGSWKDKRAGILYSRETQERNVYDIVKNKAEAKALIAEYFAPVHRHESDAIKLKNELRDKVRELDLSRKVQKGNLVSEAHAVQLLGEAEDNIRMLQTNKRMKTRDGKTLQEWEAIVENLWKESPKLDQQKIRNGVQAFREMYDDLFQRMNEVRVRNGYEPINFRSGYFPHFQAEADGILEAFGKAMGVDTSVNALPTSIDGIRAAIGKALKLDKHEGALPTPIAGLTRNFKPGIRWVGNTLERLGFDTTYDAVEGFDRYIEGVADVIYHTDDIQKLRALSAQVRYRTTDEGIRERVDQIRADGTLTDQDKETLINSIYANGRFELGNYAVNLDEYTNLLANKKSESDRNMERQVGRHMYKLTKTLEGRVAANMVAVNPASWLTNFIPITQGGAQLGPTQMLHGMWNTLVSMKTDDGVVGRSSFLTNRQGSDSLVLSRGQTWSATASAPMGWIDNFTAGSLVRARYEQNLKRGLSEQAALEEADEWAAGVMADRSKGSMPTLFHASNPLTKLFTQFQLEVNNQLSYLFKDIPREELEKGIGHLIKAYLKFFVGAWMYNEVYEYFIGRRPALDPIGILNEFIGDLTGWEIPNMVELGVGAVKGDLPEFRHEKAGTYEAVAGLLGNTAEELPFVGGLLGGGRVPIQSALPDVENLGKVIFSDDWSREKKWATAGKELLKPAAYLAPPFGGGQLKKAIEGINAWWNNGSYTVNAKGEQQLQYPIFNDTLVQSAANLAKVITFGKTTLKTGREWIENDFKTFSVNETAAYNAMVETGLQGEEAYNLLLNLRATQKTETESAEKRKQRALLESDVPADAKAAVYYAMFATDDERVLLDTIIAVGGNGGVAAETLIQMKMQEKSNGKREVLMDAGLTDWEKRQIYREKISDTRDDDIELFRKAGMDMDDFLEAQNKYTEINGTEGAKAGDKAVALSRWLNGRNYSAEQKETIKEVFKFFSQIPAEAEKYDSFTAMGMSDDEAFRLTDELSALQPEEGKKQVSNLQKWQTVVSAGLSKDKQLAALSEVMSETEYLKLNIGNGYGIDPQTYVKFKAALQTHDANGNGSYSQDEIRAAIDGMSGADEEAAFMAMLLGESVDAVFLTTEQKAVLWQLQSSSDSAKNNPYSRSVGEKVLQLKNAEDSPVAESEAALLAMLGLN